MNNLEKLAELAQGLPAKLKDNALALVEQMGQVIEGIGDKPTVWRPGTAKIVQGTSDRSKLPKGTNIGSIVIGEDVEQQPFSVIPLRSWYSRQMWDPNPDNARILCSSPDAITGFAHGECKNCQYGKFDTEANRSACNRSVTVLAISADLKKIFTLNFTKTNYVNGTDWVKLMRNANVAPYKKDYALNTETSKKSKNVEVLIASNGNTVDAKLYPFLEELAKLVHEDRTTSLASFYEYVKNRKTSHAELGAPEDVVMLEVKDVGATEVPASDVHDVSLGGYTL